MYPLFLCVIDTHSVTFMSLFITVCFQLEIILVFFLPEVDAYYCISALVGGSQSKFLSQTKIANEAHWRAA